MAETVAIIDDNPSMTKVLSLALRAEGRRLLVYNQPKEAVGAILADPPDLVITDLSMPGMSGHDVIARLRERFPPHRLPIIVVSAVGLEDAILKAFRLGADDYMVKPFENAELRTKVRVLLARRQAAPAPPPEQVPGAALGRLGPYELLELLGEGGMGAVYRARDSGDGSIAALKVLAGEHSRDETLLERFLREAAILKGVDHPNITRFYDLRHFQDRYFIAMEYVPGVDLEEWVDQHGAQSGDFVRRFLRQAGAALQYLHERGMVHRDIKPSNFLWDETGGRFKLTDFGLTLRHSDRRFTSDGVLMGTLEFFAPEQITAELPPDIRSDLFSLGSTAYYLLSGVFPFADADDREVLRLVVRCDYQPLVHRVPTVPADLAAVITRLMLRDPERRFATPAAMVQALG